MSEIGSTNTPLHQLRVALGRILIDFQDDLRSLENDGLDPHECEEVKAVLKSATEAFRAHSKGPGSPYFEIAKHFQRYADVYKDWNGHEGKDPGKPELRRKEIKLLSERRKALFKKLGARQQEVVASGQLDLPFVNSVRTPLAKLAEQHPAKFSRLRQATVLFG